MAVSPFDGANRIRFKGSPNHCQISIADFQLAFCHEQIDNRQSEIGNDRTLSLAAPPKAIVFNLTLQILRPLVVSCKLNSAHNESWREGY
jgi:hypothetical protein